MTELISTDNPPPTDPPSNAPPPARRLPGLLLTLSVCLFSLAAAAQTSSATSRVEVRIKGIEGELLQNVQRYLSILQLEPSLGIPGIGRTNGVEVTPREIRRRHYLATRQIEDALVPFGHYLPRVVANLEETSGGFIATYRIRPGPAATLSAVDIQVNGDGAEHAAIRRVLTTPLPRPGDALSHPRYTQLKEQLFDAAYNNGYLDAHWQASEIAVAADRLSATITLQLQTGPQFYFGAVAIEQQILNERFMSRYVHITPGDPYDVNALLRLQRDLNLSGYFANVEIKAERDAADEANHIPVMVATTAARPRRYSVGLGYGTDTGPRTRLDVLWRRVNSRGHRLNANIHASANEQAIGTRYEIPIRNVARDNIALSATARTEEIGDAETDRYSIRAEHNVDWLGFRRTAYIATDHETFDFDSEDAREVTLLYPGLQLTRERTNDPQFPTIGYALRMDMRVASEALVSEVSFARLALTGRWVRGISERTRLLLAGQVGALWTDDFDLLPPSHRFFTGGDNSIRGYAFEEVAPRNAGNDVIGGERMVAASAELEHMFFGDYGAAVFVDAGDAFNDTPDIKLGAGLGLRWRSPVGVVKLDLAHPFDDDDTSFRVHFTIGVRI